MRGDGDGDDHEPDEQQLWDDETDSNAEDDRFKPGKADYGTSELFLEPEELQVEPPPEVAEDTNFEEYKRKMDILLETQYFSQEVFNEQEFTGIFRRKPLVFQDLIKENSFLFKRDTKEIILNNVELEIISNYDGETYEKFGQVITLALNNCDINNDSLKNIDNDFLKKLVVLELADNPRLTEINKLSRAKNLKHLSIGGCTQIEMKDLEVLQNIELIELFAEKTKAHLDNPENYQRLLFEMLPSLEVVDCIEKETREPTKRTIQIFSGSINSEHFVIQPQKRFKRLRNMSNKEYYKTDVDLNDDDLNDDDEYDMLLAPAQIAPPKAPAPKKTAPPKAPAPKKTTPQKTVAPKKPATPKKTAVFSKATTSTPEPPDSPREQVTRIRPRPAPMHRAAPAQGSVPPPEPPARAPPARAPPDSDLARENARARLTDREIDKLAELGDAKAGDRVVSVGRGQKGRIVDAQGERKVRVMFDDGVELNVYRDRLRRLPDP